MLATRGAALPHLGPVTKEERVEDVVAGFVSRARAAREVAPPPVREALDLAIELVRPARARLGARFPLLVHLGDGRPSWLADAAVVTGQVDAHLRLPGPRLEDPSDSRDSAFGPAVVGAAARAMDVVRMVESAGALEGGYAPLRIDLGGVAEFVDGPSFGLPVLAVRADRAPRQLAPEDRRPDGGD